MNIFFHICHAKRLYAIHMPYTTEEYVCVTGELYIPNSKYIYTKQSSQLLMHVSSGKHGSSQSEGALTGDVAAGCGTSLLPRRMKKKNFSICDEKTALHKLLHHSPYVLVVNGRYIHSHRVPRLSLWISTNSFSSLFTLHNRDASCN